MPQQHFAPLRARLRGLGVVALAAATALPLLAATSSRASSVDPVLALARAQVGDAYAWGGNGPDAWDCSGLTSWVWREAAGVVLPRVSGDQQRWAVPLPREQLLPGDLVFYGEPVSHVALYVGDGRIVDASSAKKGVLERAMWSAAVVRYGRVPREGMPEVQPWTPPAPPSPSASPSPSPSASPGAGAGTAGDPTGTADSAGAAAASPAAVPTPSPSAPTPNAPTPKSPAPGTPAPGTPAPSTASSTPAPVAPARATAAAARPLPGLPARQAVASSRVALSAVKAARARVGHRTGDDLSLVRVAWRAAGGGVLPARREALVARSLQVPRTQVRVGDLVTYGTPVSQTYLYVGGSAMVGRSPEHRRVVVRRVHTGDVRFWRLPVAARR